MITFFNLFLKITAWPAQKLVFRIKVYYEDKKAQSRHIKGPAIIVSNHTSVFDYAAYLFVFFTRTLRFQMAEVLFEKKVLGTFLKCLGGIYIDRNARDLGFMDKTEKVLINGGVAGIFPEGRLPLPEEERPLEFRPGAAYLALATGARIIPVFTNGAYFNKRRARVMIGKPVHVEELVDKELSDKENLRLISRRLRQRIIDLEKLMYEKQNEKDK